MKHSFTGLTQEIFGRPMLHDEFDDAMGGGYTGNDDGMVIDLDGVDENLPGFVALPPGIYDAVVENVEYGPSKAGNPMLTWTFTLTDPEYKNRKMFYHCTLNKEAGVASLKRTLVRVLPDHGFSAFNPKNFADEGSAIGAECRVKLNVKPYNGEKRNNVVDVLAASAGGFLD
jgi:hypothetical protein